MTRAAKIFSEIIIPTQDAVTLEGVPAYAKPTRERYLQLLLTNTLGNTFYASAKDLLKETKTLHAEMAATDPDFALKAVLYAREKGFMRTQPIYGLAVLSKIVSRDDFTAAFDHVIRTPKDLSDFTVMIGQLRKGQGGRRIKKAAGRWLTKKLSEYWAIKYGAEKGKGDYSLRDLLCVYHPKSGEPNPIMEYLVRGTKPESGQIAAFEALKVATTDEEKIASITEGRLPHEVASSFAGKSAKVWKAIVSQMPAFALLRNMATLERHGVMDAVKAEVYAVLGDQERVRGAMILPFRFLDAMEKIHTAWARDLLRIAIENSFASLPDIPGKTAVFIDVSGSMQAQPGRIAAIFGVALAKKSDAMVVLFNEHAGEFPISKIDSLMTQAEKIVSQIRGGTDCSAPMKAVTHDRLKFDNIVIITDEHQNHGQPFYKSLLKYRAKVNGAAKCFVVDVAPYTASGQLAFPGDPDCFAIYGWSDQVLHFISMGAQGFGTMAANIGASDGNRS